MRATPSARRLATAAAPKPVNVRMKDRLCMGPSFEVSHRLTTRRGSAIEKVRILVLSIPRAPILLAVRGLMVHGQEIETEVAVEVAPDRVNMIGAVLNVVVLDQKRRPLDAIVMGLTVFGAAGPG